MQKLLSYVPAIRDLTKDTPAKFQSELSKILGECCIAVVYLCSLGGSFLQGAGFIDGRKIVTALTDRGRGTDKFWFSVFHEVYHIKEGHTGKAGGASEAEEALANEYAQDVLIPPDKYKEFTCRKDYTCASVKNFAAGLGIDAGIIAERLQTENEAAFDQFNCLKTQYELS